MEKKIIVYFYKEQIAKGNFSATVPPFTKSPQAHELGLRNFAVFKDSGGLRVMDYFSDPQTHVRASFWNSAEDYQKWAQHPKLAKYLALRTEYNSKHGITQKLEGPFEAFQYE